MERELEEEGNAKGGVPPVGWVGVPGVWGVVSGVWGCPEKIYSKNES